MTGKKVAGLPTLQQVASLVRRGSKCVSKTRHLGTEKDVCFGGKMCAMGMNGLKGFSLGHIFTVDSCWWAVIGSGDTENVQRGAEVKQRCKEMIDGWKSIPNREEGRDVERWRYAG